MVVFNAGLDQVRDWRDGADHLPPGVRVVADPSADLYRDLGTERQNPVALVLTALGGAWRSAKEGLFARPTRTDMLRLGADVAVDADGEMVLVHRAANADDRLPIADLIAATSRGGGAAGGDLPRG